MRQIEKCENLLAFVSLGIVGQCELITQTTQPLLNLAVALLPPAFCLQQHLPGNMQERERQDEGMAPDTPRDTPGIRTLLAGKLGCGSGAQAALRALGGSGGQLLATQPHVGCSTCTGTIIPNLAG